MFNSVHELVASGLGIRKTIGKLRRNAYWIRYKSSIINRCRKCVPCEKRKYSTKTVSSTN